MDKHKFSLECVSSFLELVPNKEILNGFVWETTIYELL